MFFFKQKTAYEMRISDWSSDVCSSDLIAKLYQFASPARYPGDSTRSGSHAVVSRASPPAVPHASNRPAGAKPCAANRSNHAARSKGVAKPLQIGRASCRDRVCQYVYISVGAVSLKKHNNKAPTR